MNRPRRGLALTLLLASATLLAAGDEKAPQKEKGEDKWLVDRDVTVTPAASPVPALKYRLYPSHLDRKDGNAVPIYLRFAHERNDANKKRLMDKPAEWNKLPLDRLPLAEAKEFLAGYRYNLKQIELGARRKVAEWNYTFDAGNPIGMLLPDVQEMRIQAPLLVLKARVEVAEGRLADAVRSLETGFSFSQQVSEAPFLISSLVGVAVANLITEATLELAERPDAPNLYWALAVLPRPLIDLRKANEFEQGLIEIQFPDLADLDRPRSAEEWDAALRRVRLELERLVRGVMRFNPARPGTASSDPASKSPDLDAARRYLTDVGGRPAAQVAKMPPAEVLLRYFSLYYHEYRDEVYKGTYLPYLQARPVFLEADKRLKELTGPDATEAARLPAALLPAIAKVQLAQARLERKLAALRVIEALRMHAAATGGTLPNRLADVKVVPVPNDPGTGQPFEYRLDGGIATITSRVAGEPLATNGLRYRVTLRK